LLTIGILKLHIGIVSDFHQHRPAPIANLKARTFNREIMQALDLLPAALRICSLLAQTAVDCARSGLDSFLSSLNHRRSTRMVALFSQAEK
jgi:hypothetical protein